MHCDDFLAAATIAVHVLSLLFGSCWQRRIKIPLQGITWEMIDSLVDAPKRLLQATIPGTGKDGGPSCATVNLIDGWKIVKNG